MKQNISQMEQFAYIKIYDTFFGGTTIAEISRTDSRHHQNKQKEIGNSAEIVEVKVDNKRHRSNSSNSLLQDLQCPIRNSIEDTLEETKDSNLRNF